MRESLLDGLLGLVDVGDVCDADPLGIDTAVQGGQQPAVYARDHPLHKGDDAQLLPIQIDMRLRAGAAALPGSQV